MRLPKKIKKKFGTLRKKLRYTSRTTYYIRALKKKALDERAVFLESKGGKDIAGNIFYLVRELCGGQFADFTVYLAAGASMVDFLRQSHNLPNPQNNHLFLCGIFLSRPFSNRTEGASFSVHAPGVHRYFDVLPFTPVFQSDREGFFLCPCAGRAPLLRCSTFHARAHKKKSETY